MHISKICFLVGLTSIPISICLWFIAPNLSGPEFSQIQDAAVRGALASAHAERWGIFVGLWPATLLILSHILSKNNS
jgi:hypothetical protein